MRIKKYKKIRAFLLVLSFVLLECHFFSQNPLSLLKIRPVYAAVVTYTSGTGVFSAPAGTTTLVVELWGGGGGGAGGGGGNGQGNGGGGGGAYAIKTITNPSGSYPYAVGAGGAGGPRTANTATSGSNTTFGITLVIANGGIKGTWVSDGGGAGGAGGTGGTGDLTRTGGSGAAGSASGYSGGGGGAAGTTNAGGNAVTYTGGTGGSDLGGDGGGGFNGNNGSGLVGLAYGGGGGGSTRTNTGAGGYSGYIRLTYYSPPTVTTQAVSDESFDSATANGNITGTGDRTVTRRGFCYMVGTTGDPTTANSTVYEDGSYGTGTYSLGLTGLSSATDYRVRSYAVNDQGTSYGTTVQLTTLAMISISLTSDGTISYGTIPSNGTRNTTSGDLNDTQIVRNDSGIPVDLNIKTGSATGGISWGINSSPGNNKYVHEFSTNGGGGWTKFITSDSYQLLTSGIATTGSQPFDLRITVPTSSDGIGKSIDIVVQAVAPE